MAIAKITAWSFSRWKDYEQCPRRAKYKHVDRMKEPPNAAMQRGADLHKMAEDFAKGLLKKLPKELLLFKDEFEELKKSSPMVEESWAFTKDWEKTRWDDWNNCWVRIKTDAACVDGKTLYVIDHKTGKQYDDHVDQLSLYALGGLLLHPTVTHVNTQLWYIDSGAVTTAKFKAKELPALKKGWEDKTKAMLADTQFAPRPGRHCMWCPFSKSKGGPCSF